ncbi:hypothetical protein S40293_09922 [Stachybotrys chartarum IBT 40293]|nr:hypothetical protein S40293_09922 [Stachybotrys chartarum IBT 40293]
MSDSPALSSPASLLPEILTSCPTPLFPSLEEAAVGELPANPTIEDLLKIFWKNRRFVQEASLARKGAKGRKSRIRSHGMFFVELNRQEQPIGHYKLHLPQQIIFEKLTGSPQPASQAPATIAGSISTLMQPPNDRGLTRA